MDCSHVRQGPGQGRRTIDDYIYPCPIDKRVLGELGISADEFMRIATASDTDAELVDGVREASKAVS